MPLGSENMQVCELFAGVGGFRVGLERFDKDFYNTVFFNQWEPQYKTQFAYSVYIHNFGLTSVPDNVRKYTNLDIHEIPKSNLPNIDLLCGGFPCQNYSVAGPKSSKGIEGTKGVLWWDIRSTLEAKNPNYVLLENVDRLLKSPASQRGRDFGIMLKCFDELDYHVEWRVINAADYNKPQKRRRIFIFARKKGLPSIDTFNDFFGSIFRCNYIEATKKGTSIKDIDVSTLSANFQFPFENAGYMADGHIHTYKAEPIVIPNTRTLGNLLLSTNEDKYYLNEESEQKWKYLKGSKKIERTDRNGYKYTFSEGACPYPDNLDIPARTMLTSEGTLNRSSHAVVDPKTHRKRILLPIEAERIQTFPDDWTAKGTQILSNGTTIEVDITDKQRYFLMGNALVTELVTDMAAKLKEIYEYDIDTPRT